MRDPMPASRGGGRLPCGKATLSLRATSCGKACTALQVLTAVAAWSLMSACSAAMASAYSAAVAAISSAGVISSCSVVCAAACSAVADASRCTAAAAARFPGIPGVRPAADVLGLSRPALLAPARLAAGTLGLARLVAGTLGPARLAAGALGSRSCVLYCGGRAGVLGGFAGL